LGDVRQFALAWRIAFWPFWRQLFDDLHQRMVDRDPVAWWHAGSLLETLAASELDPPPAWEMVECSRVIADAAKRCRFLLPDRTVTHVKEAAKLALSAHPEWCASSGVHAYLAQCLWT